MKAIIELTRNKNQMLRVYCPKGISPTVREALGTSGNKILIVLDTPKLTNTQSKFMKNISQNIKTMATLQKSQQKLFPTLIYSLEDFLAKVLALLESGEDLKIPEGHYFLTLREYSKQNNLNLSCLKMLKDSYLTTTDKLSEPLSKRLMNWGMTVNGKCLTARISEFRRIGRECLLSDILEEHPGPKYFLSEQAMKRIIKTNQSPHCLNSSDWRGANRNQKQNLIEQLNHPKHSNNRVYSEKGLSPTLNTAQGGNRQPFVAPVLTPDKPNKRQNGRRIKENGEPSFILTGQDRHGVYNGAKIRRLTPMECERLQGFPDKWTEGLSDTQRYKTLGNAVTVNVIKAIIKNFNLNK